MPAFLKNQYILASLILVVILTAFLWQPIFQGKTITASDLIYFYYPHKSIDTEHGINPANPILSDQILQFQPWRAFMKGEIEKGIVPLWNPNMALGSPMIGNDQSAIFYPLNWFFLFLPYQSAILLNVFIKLFIAGFGMFLFIRSLRLNKISAILAGILFMFSGTLIVWQNYPMGDTAVWLPLILFLINQWLNSKKLIYLPLYTLVVALQFFSGHVETSLHIFTLAGLFFLLKSFLPFKGIKLTLKKTALFAGFTILGLAIASVQILPFYEYLNVSQAAAGREAGPNPYYLPLENIANLFVPKFFGSPRDNNWWFKHGLANYNEVNMGYSGILSFIFAGLALFCISRGRSVKEFFQKNKYILFFTSLNIFFFLIVFHFKPLFFLFTKLPLFNITANTRFLLIMSFSTIVLFSFGLNYLLKNKNEECHQKTKIILLLSPICLLILASILCFFAWQQLNIANPLNKTEITSYIAKNIILFFGLIIFTLISILGFIKKWIGKKVFVVIIALLIIIDMFCFGFNFNPAQKMDQIFPQTPGLQFLQKNIENSRVMFLGAVMLPNLSTAYNLPEVRSYDAMGVKPVKDFRKKIGDMNRPLEFIFSFYPKTANLLAVKYFATAPDENIFKYHGTSYYYPLVYKDQDLKIYQNPYAFNRAFVAENIKSLPGAQYANASTQISLNQSNRIEVQAQSDKDAYLVLSDSFYPGWKAYVDGEESKILLAYSALRAVRLPKGEHKVIFSYEPNSFKYGTWMTIFGFIILIGVFGVATSTFHHPLPHKKPK